MTLRRKGGFYNNVNKHELKVENVMCVMCFEHESWLKCDTDFSFRKIVFFSLLILH